MSKPYCFETVTEYGQTFENLPVYRTLTEKYESLLGSTVYIDGLMLATMSEKEKEDFYNFLAEETLRNDNRVRYENSKKEKST